jgi:hypothetical protein
MPERGAIAATCAALGVSRASMQRRRKRHPIQPAEPMRRASPPRALPPAARAQVLDLLHARRFADMVPAEIYATLLDEGVYHCSISSMYRILRANREVRERRWQLRHPSYIKPELLAVAPNQVWS